MLKTILVLAIGLAGLSQTASASDCPPLTGLCSVAKAGGGTRDVCEMDTGSSRLTCSQTGGSYATEMTAVSGYDTNPLSRVSVWGVDGYSGDSFCCAVDNVSTVRLFGGPNDDEINASHGADYLTTSAGTFKVRIDGRGGDDTILGTPSTHPNVSETLWGGRGDDTILAGDGDDTVMGCGTGKTCASTDVDTLKGGPGDDTITCDQNECDAWGGDGYDEIVGSAGDDTILGGAQQDKICGMEGDDDLLGGGDTDQIWGGSGNDDITGGPGEDICIGETHDCEHPETPGCGI